MKKLSYFLGFILLAAVANCGGSSSPADTTGTTPTTNTNTAVNSTSGSLATLTVGNDTLVFVPNGSSIGITDMGSATTNTGLALTNSTIKKLSVNTTTSFDVDSCTINVGDLVLACVGYNSSKVAIINISTYVQNIIDGVTAAASDLTTTEVDLGNADTGSFSGGECINCGILADAEDHRFIVSSGDGYRVLDNTGAVLKSYLSDLTATPAVSLSTENFTYDAVNNRIISPEYGTSNNFVWVINVDTDKIYRWNNRMVDISVDATDGLTGLTDVFAFGIEADSTTIDTATGALLIADEDANGLLTINMNTVVFDDTTNTFDADFSVLPMANVGSRLPGIAAESSNHYLFMEEEFGTGFAVAALPTAAATGAISITNFNWASMPVPTATCASEFFWANAGDPHGLALFTSVSSGRSKGLLINGDKNCAAIIDLEDFLNATKETGTNQVATGTDLVADGIITFVSLE
jgi:hypothetical protein